MRPSTSIRAAPTMTGARHTSHHGSGRHDADRSIPVLRASLTADPSSPAETGGKRARRDSGRSTKTAFRNCAAVRSEPYRTPPAPASREGRDQPPRGSVFFLICLDLAAGRRRRCPARRTPVGASLRRRLARRTRGCITRASAGIGRGLNGWPSAVAAGRDPDPAIPCPRLPDPPQPVRAREGLGADAAANEERQAFHAVV